MSETPAFPQEKRGGDLSGMHGYLLLLISVLAVSSWVPKRTQAAHNTCATHQRMARCSVWAAGPGRMISACTVETKAASHSTLPFPPHQDRSLLGTQVHKWGLRSVLPQGALSGVPAHFPSFRRPSCLLEWSQPMCLHFSSLPWLFS